MEDELSLLSLLLLDGGLGELFGVVRVMKSDDELFCRNI